MPSIGYAVMTTVTGTGGTIGDVSPGSPITGDTPVNLAPADVETVAIPIVEEILRVEKLATEKRVRVRTVIDEERVLLKATEIASAVDVTRVPINRIVTAAPDIREEGNVLIIPVVEEQVFVEKRLVLVEEVRITRTEQEVPVELPATRRVMRAVVERDDVPNKTQ